MISNKDMQVVVLMGGLGTRLKEITESTPKAMVDIHGKPFFHYQVELLKWYGFKKFLFLIGYKGSVVEEYFKDGSEFDISINYSYDGDKLLGTGGAIKRAFDMLEDDFLVIYGDSYMDIDYSEVVYNYWEQKKDNKKALMTIFRNKDSYDKSNVVFRDNKLLCYDKKNKNSEMEYIDYGISVLEKSVFEKLQYNEFVDLADIYTDLVKKELMEGVVVRNRFYEIGTPGSLEEFKGYIYKRQIDKSPVMFLDRDGTLNEIVFNEDIEALDSPLSKEQFKLLPKTIDALKLLSSMGYRLIIVTNQPAAAKGKVPLGKLFEVNNIMRDIFAENGIILDDVLMCIHYPKPSPKVTNSYLIEDCQCRKPKPGLLVKAMQKFNTDIKRSYMVGDSHVDVQAGKAVGLQTVFLGRYKCDVCQLIGDDKPNFTFKTLYEFSEFISRTKNTYKTYKKNILNNKINGGTEHEKN